MRLLQLKRLRQADAAEPAFEDERRRTSASVRLDTIEYELRRIARTIEAVQLSRNPDKSGG